MADSGQEQGPPNPNRRNFLKGAAIAGAGLAGGFGLRGLFLGKSEPSNSTSPVIPSESPSPTPDTSGVKHRTWERNRPDGTLAYTYPITPEERIDLERDVVNVGRAVKEVFDADALKASGLDIDQVVADMKRWDDKKISEWAHRSNTDRGRFEPDLEEVMLNLGDTGISVWYVDNVKTGEFGALDVSVPVDDNGKYSKDDPGNTGKPLTTQEGLLTLPSKLLPLVKAPSGASSAYSHDKLTFTSNIGSFKEGGELEVYDLNSPIYPTSDGQLYKLSCRRRGSVYSVSVFKHKPDVDLTIRGKGGEIKLP